jgi:hypothetical protein
MRGGSAHRVGSAASHRLPVLVLDLHSVPDVHRAVAHRPLDLQAAQPGEDSRDILAHLPDQRVTVAGHDDDHVRRAFLPGHRYVRVPRHVADPANDQIRISFGQTQNDRADRIAETRELAVDRGHDLADVTLRLLGRHFLASGDDNALVIGILRMGRAACEGGQR